MPVLRPLISVHVAKAGGSATGRVLRDSYGEAFQGDYTDNPANPSSQRVLDPLRYFNRRELLPAGIRCVHGHFHPGKFQIDPTVILFTLIRHPVDNIISIYFFWKNMKRQNDILHDYFLDQNLTIADTARLPILRWLLSKTYFEGFDMGRFNIIARHDDRDQALTELSSLIGITLGVSIRENITAFNPERYETETNTKLRMMLEDILSDDIRFYEKFVR